MTFSSLQIIHSSWTFSHFATLQQQKSTDDTNTKQCITSVYFKYLQNNLKGLDK